MCRMNYKCKSSLDIIKKFVVEVGRKRFWANSHKKGEDAESKRTDGRRERDYELRVTKTHNHHNNHREHFKRLSLLTTLYQLIPLLGFHRSDRLWRRSD